MIVPFLPQSKLSNKPAIKPTVAAWNTHNLHIVAPDSAELHIVLGEDGTLWRRLPACGRDVKVLGPK